MMNQFAYAKVPTYNYQTFDRKSLQFTNVPLFDAPPKPPAFAKQNTPDTADGDGAEPNLQKNTQDETPAVNEQPENEAGGCSLTKIRFGIAYYINKPRI